MEFLGKVLNGGGVVINPFPIPNPISTAIFGPNSSLIAILLFVFFSHSDPNVIFPVKKKANPSPHLLFYLMYGAAILEQVLRSRLGNLLLVLHMVKINSYIFSIILDSQMGP